MKNCAINLRQLIPEEFSKAFQRRAKHLCFNNPRVQLLHAQRSQKKETRANKCLLCKQIIFKLFHQKFPVHWLLFIVFSCFFLSSIIPYAVPSIHCFPIPATLRYSRAEVKKCTLTISIYAKHIIALYMITIFRNLSTCCAIKKSIWISTQNVHFFIQIRMAIGIGTFFCSNPFSLCLSYSLMELQATLHDDDESNISIMQNCIQSNILAVIKSRSSERTKTLLCSF